METKSGRNAEIRGIGIIRLSAYLPEVGKIVGGDKFLQAGHRALAGMCSKKETLRHSQWMTNLGYLLAIRHNFS